MSVTSSNPGDDENEVHDLVLMFAQSKIPRGSDAFQTILGDLRPPDENDNDSNDSMSTVSKSSQETEKNNFDEVDAGCMPKNVRTISPKPLAHVHWPDQDNRKLASSPSRDQRHHARLYVKTTPAKPILKHDEEILVPSDRHVTETVIKS